MKALLAISLLTTFSGSAFADLSPPWPAPHCEGKLVVASMPNWKNLLRPVTPFCAGTCERDFDCMPGCSCHMSGRCM